jgi:hypothetical protein
VQLNDSSLDYLDARAFLLYIQQVERHCPTPEWTCPTCVGAFESWLRQQREALQIARVKLLERLALSLERQGALEKARLYAC